MSVVEPGQGGHKQESVDPWESLAGINLWAIYDSNLASSGPDVSMAGNWCSALTVGGTPSPY